MTYIYAAAVLCGLGVGLSLIIQVAERFLASYGECRVRVNGERELVVRGGCTLNDAFFANRIFIPSACGGKGTCGYCKVKVLEGGGPVLPTELPNLTRAELRSGVRLACQVKVKNDLVVQVRPEYLSVREYRARLVAARMLTRDIRELRFALVEPAEMEFRPGQYVQVRVPVAGPPIWRAYSISSDPAVKNEIELIVRLVPKGLGSTYLHRIEPGEEIVFTGPYGEFELSEDESTELALVGGGCGMAPIKSIVHYVSRRWPARKITLFFGARSAEDVFYYDDYKKLAAERPGFRVYYALSEPKPTDVWDGERGFIHLSVDAHLKRGRKRQAFLCGPPPMIEATLNVLRSKGMRKEQVFYDKF